MTEERIASRITSIISHFTYWVAHKNPDGYGILICPRLHDKMVNLVDYMKACGVTDFSSNKQFVAMLDHLGSFYHINKSLEQSIKIGLAQDLMDVLSKTKMDEYLLQFYSSQAPAIKKQISVMIPTHLVAAVRIME